MPTILLDATLQLIRQTTGDEREYFNVLSFTRASLACHHPLAVVAKIFVNNLSDTKSADLLEKELHKCFA